jgi:signal peptidase I
MEPVVYSGRSMWPLLRPGDILTIKPMPIRLRKGDLVLFSTHGLTGNSHAFVHRIKAIAPCGYITRGDNNPCCDPLIVTPEQITGRVIDFTRGAKTHHVCGGWKGLFRANAQSSVRTLLKPLRKALKLAYSLPSLLWKPDVQILRVDSPDGIFFKYVWHKSTIARWWPGQNRFICRKPFDLFLKNPTCGGFSGSKTPPD